MYVMWCMCIVCVWGMRMRVGCACAVCVCVLSVRVQCMCVCDTREKACATDPSCLRWDGTKVRSPIFWPTLYIYLWQELQAYVHVSATLSLKSFLTHSIEPLRPTFGLLIVILAFFLGGGRKFSSSWSTFSAESSTWLLGTKELAGSENISLLADLLPFFFFDNCFFFTDVLGLWNVQLIVCSAH